MLFKIAIGAAAGLVLSGCVTTNTNYRPVSMEISEPPLGQVVTADVGNAMVKQGKYAEHEAIHLPAEVSIGLFGAYQLTRGYYLREGEDAKGEFYSPERGPEGGDVRKSAMADPHRTIMVERSTQNVCVVTTMNVKVCQKNVRFDRLKRPALTADGFQQTLIYSGRVGNKINIAYREFSNNVARPAFNNDVEYDLGESMTIGYKGAEIEVIEATNRFIRYKVIRNFNTVR